MQHLVQNMSGPILGGSHAEGRGESHVQTLRLRRDLTEQDLELGTEHEPVVLLLWKYGATLVKYAIAIYCQHHIFCGKS